MGGKPSLSVATYSDWTTVEGEVNAPPGGPEGVQRGSRGGPEGVQRGSRWGPEGIQRGSRGGPEDAIQVSWRTIDNDGTTIEGGFQSLQILGL
jgi:hypothetical protein